MSFKYAAHSVLHTIKNAAAKALSLVFREWTKRLINIKNSGKHD